ncbi:E3 ubiquitin-protein ligase Midline-1-like [Mytilus californianus]|uniref:E3 ubiquitin-protein ligase Midline-1-like n=1 Tax=Mytilus californianus TaxID=6549 RepID=UPI0022472AF4|nr:E3 ubiquitin-protein ligase Midline-1-like [Mytilus californianus]
MSTSTKDMDHFDDLLTCTICLETFKIPKYLPCLHTFCESCIKTYIILSTEKVNESEGFKCPICRQFVSYDNRPSKPEALASSLPMNHFVMSMLDKRSIQRSEKLCNSCQFNDKTNKAISWCTSCEEAFCEQCDECHKSFKVSAKHKLISINEIQSGNSDLKISEVLSCEEHPEKIVEVYCVDHSKPCCTLCATLSHRKCENVTSIVNAAKGIKQSKLTTTLVKKLDERNKELNKIIENRKDSMTKFETTSENIIQEVSTLKREVIDHLDKLEEKIKVEVASSKKRVFMKCTDEVNAFSSYKSTSTNWQSVLNRSIEQGSDQQCLMEVNKIGPKITILEKEMKEEMKMMKNLNIDFVPSELIEKFKTSTESFGCLNIVEEEFPSALSVESLREKVNFRSGGIKILQRINAANNSQTSAIFIAKYLVITSYNKSNVAKYSLDGKFLEALSVQKYPLDITQVDGTQVAISIYNRNKISFVDIAEMKLLRTLDLSGIPVHGLCCVEGSTFILPYGSTLTWVDSSGKKVKQKSTGGHSFYVSTSDLKDYIYGVGENSVSREVGDTTTFTYTNAQLNGPRGIGIDFDGNIYIAGCHSKNIHQITNDGKLIRVIPIETFGIQYPWTMRFAPNSNKFVVTCGGSGQVVMCEID